VQKAEKTEVKEGHYEDAQRTTECNLKNAQRATFNKITWPGSLEEDGPHQCRDHKGLDKSSEKQKDNPRRQGCPKETRSCKDSHSGLRELRPHEGQRNAKDRKVRTPEGVRTKPG
jgi:hypothetical protein